MYVLALVIDKLFFVTLFCRGIDMQTMSNISECYFTLSLLVCTYKKKLLKDYFCYFELAMEQILPNVLYIMCKFALWYS